MISGGGGVGVCVGVDVSASVGVNEAVGVMVAVFVIVGDGVIVDVGVLVGLEVSVGISVGGISVAVGVSVGGAVELQPAISKARSVPESRKYSLLAISSKSSGIAESAQHCRGQTLDRSRIIRGFDSALRQSPSL